MEAIQTTAVQFLVEFWQILGEMSPYLLFGFLVAGILKVLIPVSYVERHLGGRGLWQSVKAALIGVPLPLCSCSVIPVSASLRRSGAGKGATTSFLLSAPQTGVDSIAVTYSLLGPLFAVYRVAVAFITGILGGMLVDFGTRRESSKESHVDNCECPSCAAGTGEEDAAACATGCGCGTATEPGPAPAVSGAAQAPTIGQRVQTMLRYGFVTLPRDIGPALLIGLLLAGLLGALVPEHFFSRYLGTGLWPMLLMALIGIPLYICATASVPVAAALLAAGVSPGAALVFLICGPATNAATITTLWKFLGRTAALIYLGTVFIGSLLAGWILNLLYTSTSTAQVAHQHDILPPWFMHASAVALLLIVINSCWPRRARRQPVTAGEKPAGMAHPAEMPAAVLSVAGMTCHHCSASVERALSEQPGVSAVAVDLARGRATVHGAGVDPQQLVDAVTRLGYTATVS